MGHLGQSIRLHAFAQALLLYWLARLALQYGSWLPTFLP